MTATNHRSPHWCLAALALAGAGGIATHSQGAVLQYQAVLNGPSESPPNSSPGTGSATFAYDNVAHTLSIHVTFSGLQGTTTASHIHSATALPGVGIAGVATTTPTFAGFPLGVTSGTYDNVLDLTQSTSWNAAYITANGGTTAGAEVALASGIAGGQAYLNIHSSTVSSGEIRGFLQPVPGPGAGALLGAGGLWVACRRRA